MSGFHRCGRLAVCSSPMSIITRRRVPSPSSCRVFNHGKGTEFVLLYLCLLRSSESFGCSVDMGIIFIGFCMLDRPCVLGISPSGSWDTAVPHVTGVLLLVGHCSHLPLWRQDEQEVHS